MILNEDNCHFFYSRKPDQMTIQGLHAWVDQYASTQVSKLFLCPNARRVNYRSQVWDAIWDGNSPEDPSPRGEWGWWVHNAWLLDQRGIDPYAVWIVRAREQGISPWLSMRMNDGHAAGDPEDFMHSRFWREHPEYWRVPGAGPENFVRDLDYGIAAVREHHMALIGELLERYDPDGLELDWMRWGHHFRPGHEDRGAAVLSEFMVEVRRRTNFWAERRGHPIRVAVRVPAHPDAARGLGMDAIAWARSGLIDLLVPAPFWFTADYDIPVGLWRDLLGPDSRRVSLAPAMEQRLSAFPGATGHNCDAAAVFGFAAAMLARGADETYLFNHMDPGAPVHLDGDHAAIIRHAGRLETAAAQRRRHIVTYPDTWPPGVATPHRLPATLYPGAHYDFRIDTGPAAAHGAEIRVGLADDPGVEAAQLRARINLQPCGALSDLIQTQPFAGVARVVRFDVPPSTQHDGYNVFELAQQDGPPQRVVWMEVMVNPQPKVRHESLQQRDEESLGRHGEGCRATPGREGED